MFFPRYSVENIVNKLNIYLLSNNLYKPITNMAWVRAGVCKLQKGCTRLAAPCDKAYQLLARGRWFSLGTSPSSITKTGRHDINRSCIPSNNFGFLHLTNRATHPLDGFEKMNSEKLNLTFKFSHSLNALYDFTVIMPYFRSLRHPVRMVLSWCKIMFKGNLRILSAVLL